MACSTAEPSSTANCLNFEVLNYNQCQLLTHFVKGITNLNSAYTQICSFSLLNCVLVSGEKNRHDQKFCSWIYTDNLSQIKTDLLTKETISDTIIVLAEI